MVLAHFQQKIYAFSVQATLKGEEKTKHAARRQTHTQGRFLVILTVRHIFLPYVKYGKKKAFGTYTLSANIPCF